MKCGLMTSGDCCGLGCVEVKGPICIAEDCDFDKYVTEKSSCLVKLLVSVARAAIFCKGQKVLPLYYVELTKKIIHFSCLDLRNKDCSSSIKSD